MKALENKKFRDYNNIMNKNFLHNQPKPCPFKPGFPMTKECALFMENACPMFQECLNNSERGDESVSTPQNREKKKENLLSFPVEK